MNLPIERWIAVVSALLSPAMPGEAIEALDMIKPHLRGFAASAFTEQSARDVAEAKRFGAVPGWDVIAPILRQHVRDAAPIRNALPAPREPEYQRPGPEEISRIMATLSRFNAQRAEDAAIEAPAPIKPIPLTGEALRAARIATGIYPNVPRAAQAPPPC